MLGREKTSASPRSGRRGGEASAQVLEGVGHPEAGSVVEPLADDHHPGGEAVHQAGRDAGGRVATDIERRGVWG
jgi:hypothetical protein